MSVFRVRYAVWYSSLGVTWPKWKSRIYSTRKRTQTASSSQRTLLKVKPDPTVVQNENRDAKMKLILVSRAVLQPLKKANRFMTCSYNTWELQPEIMWLRIARRSISQTTPSFKASLFVFLCWFSFWFRTKRPHEGFRSFAVSVLPFSLHNPQGMLQCVKIHAKVLHVCGAYISLWGGHGRPFLRFLVSGCALFGLLCSTAVEARSCNQLTLLDSAQPWRLLHFTPPEKSPIFLSLYPALTVAPKKPLITNCVRSNTRTTTQAY